MMYANLMNNYFNPNSVYTEKDFKRRFRMMRHVFERLLYDVQQVNPYFRHRLGKASHPGFSTHQKLYKEEYICELNQEDMDQLIRKVEDREFSGMIGSLDCMHWTWKNCLTG
nr:uncharacterized protein LOC103410216 [Malus domestica]